MSEQKKFEFEIFTQSGHDIDGKTIKATIIEYEITKKEINRYEVELKKKIWEKIKDEQKSTKTH